MTAQAVTELLSKTVKAWEKANEKEYSIASVWGLPDAQAALSTNIVLNVTILVPPGDKRFQRIVDSMWDFLVADGKFTPTSIIWRYGQVPPVNRSPEAGDYAIITVRSNYRMGSV